MFESHYNLNAPDTEAPLRDLIAEADRERLKLRAQFGAKGYLFDSLLEQFIKAANSDLFIDILSFEHSECSTPVPAGFSKFTLKLEDCWCYAELRHCYSNMELKRVNSYDFAVVVDKREFGSIHHSALAELIYSSAMQTRRFTQIQGPEFF